MSSVYISAPMDEVDSARIHAGQPAKVTIDPFPDQVFPGRVVRVAPYVLDIEAQNRTVEIEVELEASGVARTLLPGTSSDVEVILEVRENVLRIPTPTLLAGNAVMVIQEAILVRRPVEIGVRNWDYIEIISGLAAGEEIVSSLDRVEVQAGAEVEIVPDGSL
jgi:HlyD family secretion protein